MNPHPGTPALGRPLPERSEAEARIERALAVARGARASITPARLTKNEGGCALDGLEALMKIISILDGGKS